MPTDLDELFGTLRRTADAVPLGTAADARRRGDRRTGTRAATAAAATVLLIGAGVGVTTRHEQPDTRRAPVATAPAAPLAAVGEPVGFGGTPDRSEVSVTPDRAFTGWRTADGTVRVRGIDLTTGRPAWPARTLGTFDDFEGVDAHRAGVLVTVTPDRNAAQRQRIHVLDPETGTTRWQLSLDTAEQELTRYADRLVITSRRTGATRARDWVTGRALWDAPGAGEAVTLVLGEAVAGVPVRSGGPSADEYTGDRLVQVTAGGKVLARDVRTGLRVRTVVGGGVTPEDTLLAYQNRLFHADRTDAVGEPYRVRVTGLDGGAGMVYRGPSGRSFTSLAACGPDRICVIDNARGSFRFSEIAAIDTRTGLEVWRTAAPPGSSSMDFRNDRLLVTGDGDGSAGDHSALYDPAGRQLLRPADRHALLFWAGADTLIYLPGLQGHMDQRQIPPNVATLAAADGSVRVRGFAEPTWQCAYTAGRLACAGPERLQIWDLSG
ncbi:outer membrane protein assembly factor BamB family protein [Jidongwangia harbinensis]|uniref:outer membrane protein assembly factor BamB family protein n=1 Tax=Jidongwangia harbinensis TaxID=2878561 RepID=UPI001CD91C65|nr:PQQ-binding-like beta-propeller repeat protein [Jidongwangia harbinensis]MCA2216700.1 PQQ-like beta-propeller repeat protein [Jidongwangia harbinensis]